MNISKSKYFATENKKLVKNKIEVIRIAYGGMAEIPKRAIFCELLLDLNAKQ